MTSASKLFHNRRIRFGVHSNAVDDKESDSSPPEGNSTRHHITTSNRRRHHVTSHNSRRNLDGCNSPPRRARRHRLPELVQLEPGGSQSPSGSSIINSEDFRNIRRWGTTENDRLPGVVLRARERLLERLRGVHVSENRQTSRSNSSSLQEDDLLLYNAYSSFIDERSWQGVMALSSSTSMLAPGLSQDALNCLFEKVYRYVEESNENPSGLSRECSICLEGFEDEDELINLPCMHTFHSCCLFPWVEVCGACPNCRKLVVYTL